jgi:digeranylgeranylglycerophospholipid reductase
MDHSPAAPPAVVDVLVAGGGPAGLATARAAAAAGARTLVLERGAEIGAPVRTSGASWAHDVAALGIPAELAHPIDQLRLVAPGRTLRWRSEQPIACVLDVRGLAQHLATEAIRAGAALRLRWAVAAPLLEDGRVVGVTARDERGRAVAQRAAVVVDASGAARALAGHPALRGLGLGQRFGRLGVGVEYELLAPRFEPHTALLLVGRDVAPHGYAWAFPRPGGRVRVGVGVVHPPGPADPRPLLARLLGHPALADALAGAQALELHTGVVPAEPTAALTAPGLLVVGDAGAQASPLLGEGIRYAIEAGRLAGAVAAAAVQSPQAVLETYASAWQARFGRSMALGWWLNRRLARYGDRNWRVVAALLSELTPAQVAAALHGDLDLGWLLAASPRLALGLLRSPAAGG